MDVDLLMSESIKSGKIHALLNLLHVSNKLIERFAPSIIKTHALVFLAVLLIPMNNKCGIFRSLLVRLKRKHSCEQKVTAVFFN
jgi:hypothetical protein